MNHSHATLSLVGMLLLVTTVGCDTTSRSAVDLSGARLGAGHDPVTIDGKLTSADEWAGAATAALPVQTSAAVLWDARGLYGRLASDFPPSRSMDECLVVVVEGLDRTNQYVRLFLANNGERVSGWVLCAAQGNDKRVELAVSRVPGRSSLAWNAEFYVPWDLISGASRPPQVLQVHMFRLGSKEPVFVFELTPKR